MATTADCPADEPAHVGDDHRGQHAQDGDHDEQLNQGETFLSSFWYLHFSNLLLACYFN
jgi:hypothetical protein